MGPKKSILHLTQMKMLLGRITRHNLFQAFRSVYLIEEKMQLEKSEKKTRKYEPGV